MFLYIERADELIDVLIKMEYLEYMLARRCNNDFLEGQEHQKV